MELIIVGYGNMAKAILGGILKQSKKHLGITQITITGRMPLKIESWLQEFFMHNKSDFTHHIQIVQSTTIKCEDKIVLLACKPNNLSAFSFNGSAFMVYSVLAGVNSEVLREYINAKHYVTIMPNIGAFYTLSSNAVLWKSDSTATQTIKDVGKRIDLLIEQQDTNDFEEKHLCEVKESIERFVSSFGNCVFVETQKELNASIATNGSSPAVLALVAQALIDAGVHQGLHSEISQNLVQKTFEGVAELLKYHTPQEIKQKVTSPNGTTAVALLHCDEKAVQGNIARALIKAVEKANK